MALDKLREVLLSTPAVQEVTDYYNYSLLPDLESFNRADTVNMNENEMNDFRHIAGSKQTLNDLGFPEGLGVLIGKEINDLMNNDGLKDTWHDLKNDARAIKMYFTNRGLDGENLYNYTFNNYIKHKR